MVYRNNTGRLSFWLHQCVLRNTLAGSKTVVSTSRNPSVQNNLPCSSLSAIRTISGITSAGCHVSAWLTTGWTLCQSHTLTLACVILEPKRVLCRRQILSSAPMCDLYLERYIGVSCTGLYVKLEVLWEVRFPLAYTLTVMLRLKNQVLSLWLKISEATKQKKTKQRRDCEDLGALMLRVGAAWCSDLRSITDSFIKGRTSLRVEYNEGPISISVFRPSTTSLFPSVASLKSLYTLFRCRI